MESSPQLQTPQRPSFSLNHRGLEAPSFYIPHACRNQTLWGERLPASLPASDSCSLHLWSRCSSPGAGFKTHTHTHTLLLVPVGVPLIAGGFLGKGLQSARREAVFLYRSAPQQSIHPVHTFWTVIIKENEVFTELLTDKYGSEMLSDS